jgi:hypothetical protein
MTTTSDETPAQRLHKAKAEEKMEYCDNCTELEAECINELGFERGRAVYRAGAARAKELLGQLAIRRIKG